MNIQSKIAVAALAFVAAACATTDEEINLLTECEFSDGSKAPAWICNFDETLNISQLNNVTWAVGRAKKNAGRASAPKERRHFGRTKPAAQPDRRAR